MQVHGRWCAIRRVMWIACVSALVACGGGGGGTGPSGGGGNAGASGTGTFSASFQPAAVNTQTIDGFAQQLDLFAQLSFVGINFDVFLFLESDSSIIASFTGTLSGDTLAGQLVFVASLPVGTYDTQIVLHACEDENCTREVTGSPVRLPVHHVVKPNISVQPQVTLARSGAEAAPTLTLPVSIPPEAGTVTLSSVGQTGIISATLVGGALAITTTQERAGQYTARFDLQGSSDTRYARSVTVDYSVTAPAGGEQLLSAVPSGGGLFVPQLDQTSTQSFTITPPSWTDSPVVAELQDSSGMMSLSHTPGTNQYTLSVNPASRPLGNYSAVIHLTAGPTGGVVFVPITVTVGAAIFPRDPFHASFDAGSGLGDLQVVTPILTANGAAAVWSASTTTSWLSVAPGSAPTDPATPLTLSADPAIASFSDPALFGSYTLTSNLPGSTALVVDVTVSNNLPWLQSTSAVLAGTGGRLYIEGALASSRLLENQALQITGATLVGASYRRDTRFAGDIEVLAVDVAGATPGTPVTITAHTPLLTTQVNVAVQAPARLAASHQPLALAAYRPARFAPGQGAFYFSSPGKVWRWQASGASAGLTQTSVVGLTGVAMPPDEKRLHAFSGASVLALDPANLSLLATSPPLGDAFGRVPNPALLFDGSGANYLPSLAYASDGRALAGVATTDSINVATRAAYWINSPSTTRALVDLTNAPRIGDPGISPLTTNGLEAGPVLVASPNLHVVAGSSPDGLVAQYLSSSAQWRAGPRLGAGLVIVATSDDGLTMVSSDGSVWSDGTSFANLKAVLALSEVAGGYGVTQDGRHALVYSYELSAPAGPANLARVHVVDLAQARLGSMSPASIISTVALSAPVGCTNLPLDSGESCQHQASITLAPGSGTAFVLGPRALAVVPLPLEVTAQSAQVKPRRAEPASARAARSAKTVNRPLGIRPNKP